MTVSDLSSRMTAAEETLWMAHYSQSPWGDERADMRSAQIAQIIYNQNVKRSDRKPMTAFMPFYRKVVKAQENVTDSVRSWFGNLKGK